MLRRCGGGWESGTATAGTLRPSSASGWKRTAAFLPSRCGSSRSRRAVPPGSRRQAENGSDRGLTRNRHFRAETDACQAAGRPGGREDAGGAQPGSPSRLRAVIEAPAGAARRPAALTLFLLAALIPETVAAYNPPPLVLLARPLDLLFFSAFYGSVALIVREFMRRRAVRWASILLLGWPLAASTKGSSPAPGTRSSTADTH